MNKSKIILFAVVLMFSMTAFCQTNRDSVEVRTDTLQTVVVEGQKELPVVDAIRKSMGAGMKQPGKKSVSDVLGKGSDYVLHPFAYKQRQKEKNKKRTQQILEQYDNVNTTYEDELTAAIYAQMREDSIAAAQKQAAQKNIKK